MSDHTATLPRTAAPARREPHAIASALPAGLARPVIAHAALLGLAADVLLRDGPTGIGFPIWVALGAIAITSLVWRAERNVPRETQWWLAVAILFAGAMAWRASEDVRLLNALTVLGALGFAGITLSQGGTPVLFARLRDTIVAAVGPALSIIRGILPLTVRELFAASARDGWGARARPFVRAAVIASVLLIVFGSLLTSADPIFASLVSLPDIDFEVLASHVLIIGAFSWLSGGLAIGALEEFDGLPRRAGSLPISLGIVDVTTILATLGILFATFMLAQVGWLFGGEQFLHERTGLTAAEYARRGFFEMTWVVVLVLPVLLGTRALLAPGRALIRRYTLLAIPVVLLLGAIIGSAALRMKLYVHYYGLTLDRVNTLVFMGWLGFVLVWFAATVLRGRERAFMAGAMLSALAVVAGLNVMVPDRFVARENLARAAVDGGRPVDLEYLARLGAESADYAVAAVLRRPDATVAPAGRCVAARRLLSRWGTTSSLVRSFEGDHSWRSWNAGEHHAARVVGQNSAALRDVMHETCVPGEPQTAYR